MLNKNLSSLMMGGKQWFWKYCQNIWNINNYAGFFSLRCATSIRLSLFRSVLGIHSSYSIFYLHIYLLYYHRLSPRTVNFINSTFTLVSVFSFLIFKSKFWNHVFLFSSLSPQLSRHFLTSLSCIIAIILLMSLAEICACIPNSFENIFSSFHTPFPPFQFLSF